MWGEASTSRVPGPAPAQVPLGPGSTAVTRALLRPLELHLELLRSHLITPVTPATCTISSTALEVPWDQLQKSALPQGTRACCHLAPRARGQKRMTDPLELEL